jgi:Galactosyltransferase
VKIGDCVFVHAKTNKHPGITLEVFIYFRSDDPMQIIRQGIRLVFIILPLHVLGVVFYINHEPTKHFINSMIRGHNDKVFSLKYLVSTPTHPCVSNILYGIFTTADKTEQRQAFRRMLKPHPNITVRFVLGAPRQDFLVLEQNRFGDMMFLDCEENMNLGKSYTFFTTATEQFPCFQGYIKADDDTAPSLERLYRLVKNATKKPTLIGRMNKVPYPSFWWLFSAWLRGNFASINWYYSMDRYITGMAYFMNRAAAKRLASAQLHHDDVLGDEDIRMSYLMRGATFIDVGNAFHDHPAFVSHNWSRDITNTSVAVHQCKTIPLLLSTLQKLLDPVF